MGGVGTGTSGPGGLKGVPSPPGGPKPPKFGKKEGMPRLETVIPGPGGHMPNWCWKGVWNWKGF